ncbi:MAG: hypothetical protein KBS43_02855 [Oscillospiraceae bacterium]|nr:hypothetical protein [Candidatus Limimonas coprohippi]
MDLSVLMRGKQAWDTFKTNHPKFPQFLNYIKTKGLPVDSEINITVTYPDGQNVKSTIKVKPEDLELLSMLQGMMN